VKNNGSILPKVLEQASFFHEGRLPKRNPERTQRNIYVSKNPFISRQTEEQPCPTEEEQVRRKPGRYGCGVQFFLSVNGCKRGAADSLQRKIRINDREGSL